MKLNFNTDTANWPLVGRFVDEPSPVEAVQDVDGETTVQTERADTDRTDGEQYRVTEDLAESHRSLVASDGIDFEHDFITLGDQWARGMFVDQWPDVARNGFLQSLFADSGRQVDIMAQITYRDQNDVEAELEHKLGDLEADRQRQEEKRSAIRGKVGDVVSDVRAVYDAHLDGVPALDTSMYLTVRGQSKEQVRRDSQALRKDLAKNPANLKAVTARGAQKQAFQSASPVAKDFLGKQRMMMSKAVASMFFFGNTTFIEPEGVILGFHAMNGEPIIVDRFGRETGYNWLVIGDIGSGKSFFSKTVLQREFLNDEDTIIVMLDPLEGFAGINEALGGKRVIVGGDEGVNPLELNPTPRDVLKRTKGLDPYSNKIEDVDSFFENYFALRSASDLFAQYRDVYDTIVRETYSAAGISSVPYTHKRPSPTICPVEDEPDRANMFDVAIDIIERPEEYADTPSEEDRLRDGATWFKRQLEPFREGGKYSNLGGTTDIDMAAHDILYLDLQQMEGRDSVGLMIQQMMTAVNERAKTTNKRIVFSIDESKYLTQNAANLQFLEQQVRHSRHYDLSIMFITQTIDEWFDRPEAKAIADNCSLRTLFQTEGLDGSWASRLDMNERELEFGSKATAGSDDAGYSECLMGISDEEGGGEKTEWYPMHVQASDDEAKVVDFEADKQGYAELPGMTPEMAAQREAEIEESYQGYYEEPDPEPKDANDGDHEQSATADGGQTTRRRDENGRFVSADTEAEAEAGGDD